MYQKPPCKTLIINLHCYSKLHNSSLHHTLDKKNACTLLPKFPARAELHNCIFLFYGAILAIAGDWQLCYPRSMAAKLSKKIKWGIWSD